MSASPRRNPDPSPYPHADPGSSPDPDTGSGDAHGEQEAVLLKVPRHLVPVVKAVIATVTEPEVDLAPSTPITPVPGDEWDRHAVLLLALTANKNTLRLLDELADADGTEVDLADLAEAIGRSGPGTAALAGGLTTHVRARYSPRRSPIIRRQRGAGPRRTFLWHVEPSFAKLWRSVRDDLTSTRSAS